jgi:predicted CoA-binding protein
MVGSKQLIDEFLAQRRIAVVGVSRNPKDINRTLFREFRKRGYDALPVNPQATELDGQRCYARVQEIQPMVEAALLLTPPEITEKVVWDCAEAGIHRVWMFRVGGKGAVSQAALGFCSENGIRVVPGFCPLMFLRDAAWFHRLHGWVMKITGSYPR